MIPRILAMVDALLVFGFWLLVEGAGSSIFVILAGGSESSSERLGSLITGLRGFMFGSTGKKLLF